MADKAIVNTGDQGEAFWMLGGLYEVLLSSDETNGETTIMKMTMPKGMGPPPHTHPGEETVYVADGTITYHIAGEMFDAGPGSLFHIPRGTVERFEPTSEAQVVVTYRPGGIEKFFAEAGEPARRREVPPAPTSPPDIARLVEIGKRHGMDIQPPEA